MEHIKKFIQLNLHNNEGSEGDFSTRAFTNTASLRQHQDSIDKLLGAVFNPYAAPEAEQYVAVVGAEYVNCYRVVKEVNILEHVWAVHFPNSTVKRPDNRKEDLFCVAWAFDTFDHDNGENPYKIVCGGQLGYVYVIDFATRELDNRLQSFGGDINDIRTCPTNSDLIACASADQSIRILHIRNSQSLITIGGIASHPSCVLSVDWHHTGDYLVTGGMDHQVMKWDLSTNAIKAHLKNACDELANGERNIYLQENANKQEDVYRIYPAPQREERPDDKDAEKTKDVLQLTDFVVDHVYHIYTPIAVSADLHTNYVDCVRFIPGTDVIVSKDCGEQPSVNIFRFDGPIRKNEDAMRLMEPETCTTKYMSAKNENGDTWFNKFAIDPKRRWLAVGATRGIINFFDLQSRHRPKVSFCLTVGKDTVRQVDFSTCGRFMVATGDDKHVVRLDRVPDTVDVALLTKFGKNK